jgi:hypothetical protein
MDPYNEHVSAWLELIDNQLAQESVPVAERISYASSLFVEYAVMEVSNDDDPHNGYLVKSWFKCVYQATKEWYFKKYGGAIYASDNDTLLGAIRYFGDWFEINVPRFRREVEKENETAWFTFPSFVWDDENPTDWIKNPPKLNNISVDDRHNIEIIAKAVSELLRQIHADMYTIETNDDYTKEISKRIIHHIETAAAHFLGSRVKNLGLGCWEAQQYVEWSLKMNLRQMTGSHDHTHDIKTLHKKISDGGRIILDDNNIKVIPSEKEIIKIRSGETMINGDDAFRIYLSSLDATAKSISALNRKISIRDASFLIRKAPFID